jgi:TRAP-type mannitol/chloroaromatic compound transport system permease small subunit
MINRFAGGLSQFSGKAVAWLILILILQLVYDTLARYLFNKPTLWSYDVSYMLYAIIFLIGGAYTLLDDEHIRIEIFYTKFSKRQKAIADILGYLIFFFPVLIILLYSGVLYTIESWEMLERSTVSYWGPPVYHFKGMIPLATLLMLIQGIAIFIRLIAVAIKGKENSHGN